MNSLLRCRIIIAALLAMLCCGTASATITLSTTTRAGTSATGAGTDIDCRGPCPVVIDAGSGTTSTHSTGDVEQVGIRFAEKKITNCDYTHNGGTLPTITCNNSPNLNSFTTLSWELNTASTSGGTDWTAYSGTGDANEYYHDGGTEVHGKPIGVRISGSDASEGTCCALTAGQWGWCNALTCDGGAAPNANRVTVQLSDNTDPDANPTATVQVLYGDGEYIEVSHSTWNSGNPVYVYVNDKTDDDTIVLAEAPTGASGDITDDTVTVFQGVNPWTDLRYNYSVSCPNGGGNCIEDITNGDQRPGLTTTAIDETVGRGPIWAFVFKEGFGSNATITVTAYDDANGDTTDSQTIDVDETADAWTTRYLSATGSDGAAGTSTGTAWQNWHTGVNWLRTATPPAELVLIAGETIPYGTIPTTWATVTGDRRIRTTVAGTKAVITWNINAELIPNSGHGGDLRIYDLELNKTGGTSVNSPYLYRINSARGLVMRVDADCAAASHGVLAWGTGNLQTEDSVIWDSIAASTKTAATNSEICVYADYTSTSKRRAMVGTVATTNTTFSVVRLYATHILTAYNDISYGGTGSDPCLRLNGDTGSVAVTEYWYSYANRLRFLSSATSAGQMWVLKDNATGEVFDNILQDSDFMANETASTSHNAIALYNCRNLLSKNCIFAGFNSGYTSGEGITKARVFNNSFYSGKAVTTQYHKDAGSGSGGWGNLKIINNAQNVKLSAAGSKFIENNNTLSSGGMCHFLENVVDWGTVSSMYDVTTLGTGGFTGAGWPAESGKAAQLNYTGNQGKDNDPLFALPASNDFRLCTGSGVPDASCSGASPCIDAGYDLPTVYYDYSGAVRNSDDIGAWDDDSSGAAMSGGEGSLFLLGIGR